MKVIFHKDFYRVYARDPAASSGRMESIVRAIEGDAEFIAAEPASEKHIRLAHTEGHINRVRERGLYPIAALAAGGALQAARIGLEEPAFGLIRPPGHHASADGSWGFCYFNNMAIALLTLKQEGRLNTALVLDVDLHFGDGAVNILGDRDWVTVYNPSSADRKAYLEEIDQALSETQADEIGVSAGFDYHLEDWGGLLATEDYRSIGKKVARAARASRAGCFAILEGGYNHSVLGRNAAALMDGLAGDWGAQATR